MSARARFFAAVLLALAGSGCTSEELRLSPVEALNAEGVRRLERGDLEGAEHTLREALERAELLDDLPGQAQAWDNLGAHARIGGDAAEALRRHRRARMLSEAIGDATGRARSLQGEAAALLRLERSDDARKALEAALSIRSGLGDGAAVAATRVALAAVALEAGDPAGAERHARAAEAWAREALEADPLGETRDVLAGAVANRGAAEEALGRAEAARASFEEVLAIDRDRESPRAVALDLEALARLAEARGDAAAAAVLALRLSAVRHRLGDLAGARASADRALALAREAGAAAEAAAARARLEEVAADAARRGAE